MNTRVEELFAEAHEMLPEEREAFLADACGEDAELRLEVQRLLIDAGRADSFFGDAVIDDATLASDGSGQTSGRKATPSSSPAAPPPEPITEKEGDVIGPFKLLQEIGEGGFGTVWMAEQGKPITRRVALKVIKAGMDTREVLARFEAERQALAMMDHPNIAKVLDAGATPTGRPWFAMELVKGIPITQFCDEHGLGTRERLALFGDVCSAINHAHQKGIIHRDIKPSNVMVTLYADKPVVKVIDFGIAKATQGKLTDQTLFTRFEQFIGTPVYMSPEQAALSAVDVDTRSDIYALGVLLYELLVGKPPFDAKTLVSAGYDEMRRIIREEEPPRPSLRLATVAGEERTTLAKTHRIEEGKLNKLVEPDLDWIVMKAIDKDRSRRYETANAFAQDILRFLTDEAVTARPPSAGYQLQKFARRNKAGFRVAATIALLLAAAAVVSSWQAVRATRAEQKTAETLAEVEAERDAKEKALEEAEAVTKFLTETFQSPDPTRDGRTITVAGTLDVAAEKLETDLIDQHARRAKLQATLGNTYCALGLYQQARPLNEKSRDYFLETLGPRHPRSLQSIHDLATIYYHVGQRDEALKMLEELSALRREILGPEHPDTLETMVTLAFSLHKAGQTKNAVPVLEEAVSLRRKVLGPKHPDTLMAMHFLADIYQRAGGHQKVAFELFEQVLSLRREVLGPEHPDTLATMHYLAVSHYMFRPPGVPSQPNATRNLFEEVLALREKVLGLEHPDTLWTKCYLARYASGAEAVEIYEEILQARRKILGDTADDTLLSMLHLGRRYNSVGRHDDAHRVLEEMLDHRGDAGLDGPEIGNVLSARHHLAIAYHAVGRLDEALEQREELLALRRKVSGDEHPSTLNAMNNLAEAYQANGETAKADDLKEEVNAIRTKAFWGDHAKDPEVTALYESGLKPTALRKTADGAWSVQLGGVKDFSDLAVLQRGAPISELDLFITTITDLSPLHGMALRNFKLAQSGLTDLEPLRDMPLEVLHISGTQVTDLTPLAGLPLRELNLNFTPVTDLAPLRDLPLSRLNLTNCKQVIDLSPLADCQELTALVLPPNAVDIEFLRTLPKLERLSFEADSKKNYRPDKTAAEFWAEYDERNDSGADPADE